MRFHPSDIGFEPSFQLIRCTTVKLSSWNIQEMRLRQNELLQNLGAYLYVINQIAL